MSYPELKVQVSIGGFEVWIDPIPYKNFTVVGNLSVGKAEASN